MIDIGKYADSHIVKRKEKMIELQYYNKDMSFNMIDMNFKVNIKIKFLPGTETGRDFSLVPGNFRMNIYRE
jgi:hypothetical protein